MDNFLQRFSTTLLIGLATLSFSVHMHAQDIYKKGWIDFNKNGEKDVYEDPKAAVDVRIDDLMAQMTLQEKVGQLNQYSARFEFTGPKGPNVMKRDDIVAGHVGSVLNVTGHQRTLDFQKAAIEKTRLGIPLIYGYDVIHGFRTIFPVPLAMASSFDLETIEKAARIAATESAAAGLHWTFAPMVDITHDPRWGRIMEGAGEDTWYGSLAAAAQVRGFQGDDLGAQNTILACVKHFAAYGLVEGGRDYNTVDVSERSLREIYLPPFKAAIDAGAGSLMNAFNEMSSIPATGNAFLLKTILRDAWRFQGFVVSDWGSVRELMIHGFVKNNEEAAKLAIELGVDLDMEGRVYRRALQKIVEAGDVDVAYVDAAVKRLLKAKFALGLFDHPLAYSDEKREQNLLLHPDHLAASRDAARKSMVLLKNESSVLPLSKSIKKLAVIGPLAASQRDMIASWAAQGQSDDVISPLAGLKAALQETEIFYEKGSEIEKAIDGGIEKAVAAAEQADAAIVFVGERWDMTGEAASRAYPILPKAQEAVVKAVAATGKPVAVILMCSRPLVITSWNDAVSTILVSWLPGTQAGHALADVLFGDYNPAGKLTASWPYAIGQIPVYYNHKNTGRPQTEHKFTSKYIDIPNEPLYAFGHGLSYTSFEISDLKLYKNEIRTDEKLTISVNVKNRGALAGEDVVQLYIRDIVGSVTRPVKELRGFEKIMLQPGTSKTVQLSITADDLAFWNIDMKYIAEPGDFKVFVGSNSVDVIEADFKLVE